MSQKSPLQNPYSFRTSPASRRKQSLKIRTYDEPIVVACGEKLAYGYQRVTVTWWLQRKQGLRVNRKRMLRVLRERGLLVR